MTQLVRPLGPVLTAVEMLLRLGQADDARATIAAIGRIQPDLTALQLLRGWLALLEGQPDHAVAAFRLAAGRDPLDGLAWHGIVETTTSAEERAAAAERATFLSPSGPHAQIWHDLQQNKPHLAATPLHAHSRRFPERIELALWLAETHRRLGNDQQALSLLDPLLRRRPRPTPALFLAAALLDDPLLAQQYLRDALRCDPLGVSARRLWGARPPLALPAPPEVPIPAMLCVTLDALVPPSLPIPTSLTRPAVSAKAADAPASSVTEPSDPELAAALAAVEQAAQRLTGHRLRPAPLVAADRQSVALLVLHQAALVAAYGVDVAAAIRAALLAYGAALARRGIQAECIALDDREALSRFGAIAPAAERSAAACKRTIDEVAAAIGATGREVDAVVLVGGDGLIPFHRLPNPSQDSDADVPSDNPYGCGGGSELAPELIVARFPDGGADSGRLLLDQLQRAAEYHERWQFASTGGLLALPLMRRLTRPLEAGGPVSAWGVSAAAWAVPSEAIYDELSSARRLMLCPPATPAAIEAAWPDDARLLYFNLHGLPGGPNWYGQAADAPADAPLPVALTPDDLGAIAPGLICLSEACFGAEIIGRSAADAMALRMLQSGALAFVGSTATAYGAVALPLGGADLLVQQTLQQLRRGQPLGQAVAHARDWMAREMVQRQGYLDPDDAKTLLSFVMLGDPWATPYSRPMLERKTALPQITPVVVQRRPIAANLVAPAASTLARQLIAKVAPSLARATLSAVGQGRPDRIAKGQASAVVFSASDALPTSDGHRVPQIARVTIAGGEARKLLLSR